MPSETGQGAIIGVDVGGTKTHAVCYNADFEPIGERRVPTEPIGEAGIGRLIADVVSSLLAEVDDTIVGIGVGIPGRVDPKEGSVRQAINLGIGGDPLDLAGHLTEAHGVPTRIDNDVNAAALGAYRILHSELDTSDLAYLSIGTGVAAGIILDGRLHRGSNGVAGEIGHFPVVADGPRCDCGLYGCLEVMASGTAIGLRWPGGDRSPAVSLATQAQLGDEEAIAVLGSIADHLAKAIYLLAITYDVTNVVIGGGVAEVGEPLLEAIRAGLDRLGSHSAFVRSLDLGHRLLLKPAGPIGALGAASLLHPEERR